MTSRLRAKPHVCWAHSWWRWYWTLLQHFSLSSSCLYTLVFFFPLFICILRSTKHTQSLPNNFLRIASSHSSICLVCIMLALAIRQALPKTYNNRWPGTRNRAVLWGKEQILHPSWANKSHLPAISHPWWKLHQDQCNSNSGSETYHLDSVISPKLCSPVSQ